MLIQLLLAALLLVASYTDIRWKKIYNACTYSGILAALALHALASWIALLRSLVEPLEPIGIGGALLGLLLCGGLMIACYVCFPGGVGGGDIKLMAMIGAFLGPYQGLEALLWTFILAGALAIIVLIWRVGMLEILQGAWRRLRHVLRTGPPAVKDIVQNTAAHPEAKTKLFLAPAALAGTLLAFWPPF